MKSHKKLPGFTLIEVLIVIALIAILAAITIIAINPSRSFQSARNTQRSANVNAILNAMTTYLSEQGKAITDFGTGLNAIATCSTGSPTTSIVGSPAVAGTAPQTNAVTVNLSTLLVPTYIASIPMDPSNGTATNTGYTICQSTGGRITVAAPGAEGTTISVTR